MTGQPRHSSPGGRRRRTHTVVIAIVWQHEEFFVEVPKGIRAKDAVAEFTEEHEIDHPERYALFTRGQVQLADYEHLEPAEALLLHERRHN